MWLIFTISVARVQNTRFHSVFKTGIRFGFSDHYFLSNHSFVYFNFPGMRFDAHSISSQEMTSVWASALPRMVMRRGALVYPAMMRRRHSDSGMYFLIKYNVLCDDDASILIQVSVFSLNTMCYVMMTQGL